MTTKRQRFLLILFGLIAIPLLLELILRTTGYIYYSYRIRNNSTYSSNRNTIKILCLGDSFTFGIGSPKGYSYPEQLEKMLNKENSELKFIVYNGAIPGYNSSQLSRHFEEFTQKFNPDIVVVTIGINNEGIPLESNYFLFKNKGFKTHMYKLDYFLSRFRSYELLKFAIGKLRKNFQFKQKKASPNVFIAKKPIMGNSGEYEKLIKSGDDYFEKREVVLAQEAFRNAIALNPDDERGHLGLAKVFLHCFGKNESKIEVAIEELNRALKINPHNSETFDSLWMANYRLGRNKEAQEAIVKYILLNPQDEENGMRLFHLLTRGLPDVKDTETFDKLLRYDLENIVKSAKISQRKIILQDYPSLFRGNKTIENVADELKVPFVENQWILQESISNKGPSRKNSKYFVEDGHCNADGYRIMAENIYKIVKSELGVLQ